MTVTYQPGHGVTIGDTFGRPQPRPEVMRRLLAAAEVGSFQLGEKLRRYAVKAADRV